MKQVAVDAMGGDRAPAEICRGVRDALVDVPDVAVALVGRTEDVRATLVEVAGSDWEDELGDRLRLEEAPEVIGPRENPAEAYRGKPDSSVARGIRLMKEGEVGAFISAGSTGAMVAFASLELEGLAGIHRPAIVAAIPRAGSNRPVAIVDAGANLSCKPFHLVEYGMMARIWVEEVLGVADPRIGLVNIGTEPAKGPDLVRRAHELLEASDLPYVGYVEGHDVFRDGCDIALCEAFVGNVLLKAAEGIGSGAISVMERVFSGRLADAAPETRTLVEDGLREFSRICDWAHTGGAPLLGTEGTPVICHGRSDARAIRNAVEMAARCIDVNLASRIADRAAELGTGSGRARVAGGS